ncbi:MAG TPA: nitroreductase family deazaflavin-dependent oxidoreductase [Acidimicrobiales bacterium]|nr:nitroreductase family deazaflavin-dependent oxidoreductase [Acidimicrobiales bacterium]
MSDLDDVNEFNRGIIEQFRANDGKVGPPFEGAPLLILHSTGAKTGKDRLAPIVYQPVGDAWAVFASKAGAPDNPDWYHNLVAEPAARIELGSDEVEVTARVLQGDERAEIWEKQKQLMPGFADYEAKTDRVIPVVLLERS